MFSYICVRKGWLPFRGEAKVPANITSASFPFAVFTKKDFGLEFRVVVILNVSAKLDRAVNDF